MSVVKDKASSSTSQCAYDVFLSFRGEDTRKTFTDHLYENLVRSGLHTFRDDDGIKRGENIKSELQKAIEQSRISIIVFSKTYASSRWCLDELVQILGRRKTSRQEVLPVFYDVDPSEVRKQTGSFAEAFTRHEKLFEVETDERKKDWMKRVENWRTALEEASNLTGMVLQNQCDGHEARFIQEIVKVIEEKLNRRVLRMPRPLIGIDHRVRNINLWLQDGSMDASIFALYGMGGIGKTTIAKFVYNLNRGKFDASSFLANIGERSREPNGLVNLQKQLLLDIGKERKISCVDEGIIKIKDATCCKKVLLVLDDVDQVDQLNALFEIQQWCSPGSKIIVTTRHEWLLKPHQVRKVQEVEHFDDEESLELFSWHAFGQDHPIDDYLNYSIRVVHHCRGLPLALQVLGSSLSGKHIKVWESALEKLKAIPDSQIFRKLKISYDSLQDDHDKELFLHIACFFVGWDRDWAIIVLDGCDFYATIGIQNLMDRCLLTVDLDDNKLEMHQLLQDMGREIVRHESPKEPGKRSRVWRNKDSFNVLNEKTGTDTIEGLTLDMHMFVEDKPATPGFGVNNAKKRKYEEILDKSFWSDPRSSLKRHFFGRFSYHLGDITSRNLNFVETDAFAEMHNLKLLLINFVQIAGCLKNIPKSLRWLCWHGFPLKTIPSDFPKENLVVLDMQYSSLKQVWKGTKLLHKLKILNLSHSHELMGTPDFSGFPNLGRLILEDCVSLVEVHESVLKLEGLVLLNLKDCKNLKKLPRNICMLKFLETFIISGCSSLEWFPKELRTMTSSKMVDADGIVINQAVSTTEEEVHPRWYQVVLFWVSKPKRSPQISSISLPCSLVKLSLKSCNLSDDDFPLDLNNLSSLKHLDLSETQIHSLPESIRDLTEQLRTLNVDGCRRLKSIKWAPSVKFLPFSTITSGRLDFSYKDCRNLVEIKDVFKLESMTNIDVQILTIWGFLDLESARNVSVCYHRYSLTRHGYAKKLPLQRLLQLGTFGYFVPGSKIPSEFSIRSTGSKLSFIVPSLVDHNRIQGLVVCSSYTNPWNDLIQIVIVNKAKHIKYIHVPMWFGIPKSGEGMLWVTCMNTSQLLLEGGNETVVEVRGYEVKEVGIQLVYELQEETISMYKTAFPEDFLFWPPPCPYDSRIRDVTWALSRLFGCKMPKNL